MLELLKNMDREWLLYLNSKHTPLWDTVMIFATDRLSWIPLYVLIAVYIIWKFKWQGLYILLAIGLLIIASDRISSGIFKPMFQRLRPCNDPALEGKLRVLKGCGGQYGFISSHAANTFAFVTFLVWWLQKKYKWIFLLFLWAILVSYSRIYMGVHYPGDILTGAALGALLGTVFYWSYRKFCLHTFPHNTGKLFN